MGNTLTVLALALLVAGCSSPHPAAPSSSASTTPSASTSGTTGVQAFAEPIHMKQPLNFTGQTPVGGCVFSIQSACQFQGGHGYEQRLSFAGDPIRLKGDLMITDPAQPTNVEAILFLGDSSSAPIGGRPDSFAFGPSPLHFSMNLTGYTGHLTLGIYSAEGQDFPVGFAFANVPQNFAVTSQIRSDYPVPLPPTQ